MADQPSTDWYELPTATAAVVERLARRLGISPAEVVRVAVEFCGLVYPEGSKCLKPPR